jgi:glycolate oxidase FAD binding subunit
MLDEKESRALWRDVRQVKPFTGEAARARPLWRISTAPSKGHVLASSITPAAQMFYDWAGGLIWVAMPFAEEPDAASIRGALAKLGGHATLIRAPAPVRASLDVFEPPEAGVAGLSRRMKEGFDPKRVLNPGRMWAGV